MNLAIRIAAAILSVPPDVLAPMDQNDRGSQTEDVKALSGGERSFTTLALLLAIGESLETAIPLVRADETLEVCFLVDFPTFPTPSKRRMAAGSAVDWRLTVNC
eukprot:CCRYP_010658-RC/>CCRYP_010658-RC protein AED:0.26 eAED:0.26 QI:6437/0.88/0.89/1/0.5/0.52/19/0/103